jgi:hypothetical protein
MSTCSTTMSAPRGRRDLRDLRRRLFCDDDQAAGRQLETWLMDRDACKAGRSGAPHHRRSRSATGTPSSAVTAAGPDAGLSASLSCSPRCLVYWLQHQDGGGGAVSVKRGNITGYHLHEEDDQSSVCSVLQVEHSMAPTSSCSCPHHCAALYRGYSTTSSRTVATESSFSPAPAGEDVVDAGHARKTEEQRRVTGNNRVKWFAAVAFVGVVMGVIVAMAVTELGMDDEEFPVPARTPL